MSEYLQTCSNSMQTKASLASEAAGLSLSSYGASVECRALDAENRRPPGWGRHARDVMERTRAWRKNNLGWGVREASLRPEGRRGDTTARKEGSSGGTPGPASQSPASPARCPCGPTCWCACAGRGSTSHQIPGSTRAWVPATPMPGVWKGRGLSRPEGYSSSQIRWSAG